MLTRLDDDLWEYQRPMRAMGIRIPRRMTVARLADGGLWIHSPNLLDPETRAELDALGPVRHVVAPNRYHHAYLDDYARAYPSARFHGAPGLAEKRPDLTFHEVLGDEAPAAWRDAIDQHQTRANRGLSEVAFLHRASRTLILTDWLFRVGADNPLITRVVFWLDGCYERLAPSRMFLLMVRNRAGVRASVEAMCEWDFGRILVAHGQITMGGPDALRAAFRPYLR